MRKFKAQDKSNASFYGKKSRKDDILKQSNRNRNIIETFLEDTPIIYWKTDASLRFTIIGGNGEIFSRIRKRWKTGKSLFDYSAPHWKDLKTAIKAHQSALKGNVVRYDYSFEHFILDVLAQPLYDEKGDISGVSSFAMDVTELRRAQKEQEIFHRLSQKLIGFLSLRDLADVLSKECRRLFDYHSFAFFLYYKDKRQILTILSQDTPQGGKNPVVFEREKIKTISESTIKTLTIKPLLINRNKEPVKSRLDQFGYKSRLSRSLMIVPVFWEDNMIGSLSIGSYIPDQYNKRDLEILKSLANLCSGAVARLSIKESLRLNHYAIESSINALAMVNLDGTLSYVNRAFLSLWDYESTESVFQKPFFTFWNNKDDVAKIFRDIKIRGWFTGEIKALRRDKSLFDAMVSVNLVYDQKRKPIQIMFFIQDVTAKNLSDKALRMAHFSIEKVRDAIFWISPKGRIIYANNAACSLFGYSRDEFLSLKVSDIDPPYKGKKWRSGWEEVKRLKSVLIEGNMKKKDGSFFPVEACVNFLKLENQEFHYAIFRDISKRKSAEEELKNVHEVYRKVIRNDNGIPYICHFDDSRYEFLCEDEESLGGVPLRDLTVEKFRNYIYEIVVTDPDAPTNPYQYGDAFRKGVIERYRADYKIINPAGDEVWLSDCSLPMRNPETGRVTGSFGILHDITFRKLMEKQQEALQRLSQKLTFHVKPQELGKILADESRMIFNHHAFWFSMYDRSQNALIDLYQEDMPPDQDVPIPISFEPKRKLYKLYPLYANGKPRLINRKKAPAKSPLIPFGVEKRLSLSLMFAPIIWKGDVIGALSVQSYAPNRYNEHDLRLLQSFADHCAGALTRVAFYRELEIKNQAVASSLTPLTFVDLEGRLIYSNRSTLELWDYDDLREIVGKQYTYFFKNDKKSREAYKQVIGNGEWMGELTAVREDGSSFDVHVTANLIRDDDGKPLCVMGAFRDLSQIQLTDKALHFAQYTLDHISDTIIWFYPDGSIFYINESGCRLLGYSLEELLKMKIYQIDPNYTRKTMLDKIAILKKKKYMVKETTWITKNGEIIPVEISVNHIVYNGKDVGCGFARDISDRKLAEQTIKASEEKYRLLVENANAVIVSFNKDGVLLTMNRVAAEVLGGNPQDFLGKTMWELFPQEVADSHMQQIRKVIRSGRAFATQHCTKTPNREIWYDVNIPPIIDSNGIVTGAMVIAADITEQIQKQGKSRNIHYEF
ncbi:PAS domain S-box protein [Candidatus Sumerlaeota bacterium]|nr:PAS domain S-box protein [Candidatus Sumerlaeota bacterium]